MNLTNITGFLFTCLNIYLPVNAWVSHNAGVATPLSYIGLGFAIYFWIITLTQILTPKAERKRYSEREIEEMMLAAVNVLEAEEETKH